MTDCEQTSCYIKPEQWYLSLTTNCPHKFLMLVRLQWFLDTCTCIVHFWHECTYLSNIQHIDQNQVVCDNVCWALNTFRMVQNLLNGPPIFVLLHFHSQLWPISSVKLKRGSLLYKKRFVLSFFIAPINVVRGCSLFMGRGIQISNETNTQIMPPPK